MKSLSLFASLVILLTLLFSCGGSSGSIPERPKPYKLYNDISGTNFLTKEQAENIESELKEIKNEGQYEVVILVINELHGFEPSEFAIKTGAKWGLGTKEKDNGILILIKNLGKKTSFIATGRGAELTLTDIQCKDITENVFKPNFKNKDYYKGILAGLTVIRQSYVSEAVPEPAPMEVSASDNVVSSSNLISEPKVEIQSSAKVPVTQTVDDKIGLFDSIENILLISFFALGLLIYLIGWLFFGIDPKKGKIIPEEEFNTELSPALLNSILHQNFDKNKIFIYALISLKHKKIVSFSFKTHKITFTDSVLEQLNDSNFDTKQNELKIFNDLPEEEKSIVDFLLEKKGNVYQLSNTYDSYFKDYLDKLAKKIEDKYKNRFFKGNLLFSGIGCFTHLISLIICILIFGFWWSILYFIALLFLAILMNKLIHRYTREGRDVMDKIQSFKKFLGSDNNSSSKVKNKDIFLTNLPFAIALEESENWFKTFNDNELSCSISESYFRFNGTVDSTGFNSIFKEMNELLNGIVTSSKKSTSSFSNSRGGWFSSSDSGGGWSGGSDSGGGGGDFGGGGAGSDW